MARTVFLFHRVTPALALLAVGCGDVPDPKERKVVEVNVVVTPDRVEVHAHQPGSCREASAFPGANDCETFGWAMNLADEPYVTSVCRPEPTCITEIRLERDGELVATADGPSVAFHTTLGDAQGSVILEGCEKPIAAELPAPLDEDVDFEITARGSGVAIEATGTSVASVFGRSQSLPYYIYGGFWSTCRSVGTSVELPTSDHFDAYTVNAFALGEPLVDAGIRIFPARAAGELVSRSADLDPLWEAAALLAPQSRFFETCDDYCTAWDEGCQVHSDDPDACVVSCVASGELAVGCANEWESLMQCFAENLTCDGVVVENLAEDPTRRFSASAPPCPVEQQTYDACVEAE
jgi:hypothetical protein